MTKIILRLTLLCTLVVFSSGCALIATAVSAGIGYGIYSATKH